MIKVNNFYRDGVVYQNAIVSGRYETLSNLNQDIASRFRVTREISEKINTISGVLQLDGIESIECAPSQPC